MYLLFNPTLVGYLRVWRNEMTKDPVCGMDIEEGSAQHKCEHDGKTYFFCSAGCRKAFEEDPKRYCGHETGGEHHAH